MEGLETTLLSTAKAYMEVFTNLNPETIASVQTDDHKHTFAPASTDLPGPYNRDQYASHIASLRAFLASFPVRFKSVWPNVALRQVLIWADSEAHFHDSLKWGENLKGDPGDSTEQLAFQGEYMWLLTMNESGDKVNEVLEFLDSKKTEQMKGLVLKALESTKAIQTEKAS